MDERPTRRGKKLLVATIGLATVTLTGCGGFTSGNLVVPPPEDAGEIVPDGGPADGGPTDAGVPERDAGESDAGESDAGESDAGESDAGAPDASSTP